VSPRSRATLALAGIIGPVCFTALVIVQGMLQPEYSHVRLPISALAAYPTGWIQILNFCVFGASIIALALGLHADLSPTRGGLAGIVLLVISGVGIILAGIFPWVMVNGEPTVTPAHAAAAVTSFGATGLAWIVLSRRMAADPRWHSLSKYSLTTGIAVIALFAMIGGFARADTAPLHAWLGLLQRLLCAVWFAWMVVAAVHLRKLHN
jgi:hypothetical membrane protein